VARQFDGGVPVSTGDWSARLAGCLLFAASTIGLGLLLIGIKAELEPGHEHPDVIRVFGVACLVLGAVLAAPYVVRSWRRETRPRRSGAGGPPPRGGAPGA
jgi:hypothetical protein